MMLNLVIIFLLYFYGRVQSQMRDLKNVLTCYVIDSTLSC
jgi:hypothetical protein